MHRSSSDFQLMKPASTTSKQFYDIAGFLNVFGCVDRTKITIIAPRVNEHVYVCRKGFHMLNVQGIRDAKLHFIGVVAKNPGSSHDAFIWYDCSVYSYMAQRATNDNGWLLDDSKYPLSPFLMTSVLNATSSADYCYNKRHTQDQK